MSSRADAPEFQRICAISLLTVVTTMPQVREPACLRSWWRGLDSNQRTLARADLQSAAFNHSATSPGEGRRAMWRRARRLSTLGSRCRPARLSPRVRSRFQQSPGLSKSGAGEGNRTLVVSLEGFCSTIELHPPASRQCHCRGEAVNQERLTAPKSIAYPRA